MNGGLKREKETNGLKKGFVVLKKIGAKSPNISVSVLVNITAPAPY